MEVWGAYLFPTATLPVYLCLTDVGTDHRVFDYLPSWRRPRLAWLVRVRPKAVH
jgi:hypothetical protein